MGLAAGEGARPTPPPARPPASPELPPTFARARSHWLRRAAAAARTGRPGCQSPAGGRGGAPCRGGFLFARASAGNNERDPPGARVLRRPGIRRRAPLTPRGPPARRGQRIGTAARRWRCPSSPPPPPRPRHRCARGAPGQGCDLSKSPRRGCHSRLATAAAPGPTAPDRQRRRALSLRR